MQPLSPLELSNFLLNNLGRLVELTILLFVIRVRESQRCAPGSGERLAMKAAPALFVALQIAIACWAAGGK